MFDRIDKNDAFYIKWFEDDEAKVLPINLTSTSSLEKEIEIYVVANDFSWTYIKTHENFCGPYFMHI